MNVARTFAAVITVGCLLWTATTGARGTAITYQGRLGSDSASANGTYDFTFSVHDALTSGSQVGVTTTNFAVAVSHGLFAAPLDFGPGVFNGAARWLEIGVRTNGVEAFTVLNPRQPLTATPYALYAPAAGTALTAQSAETVAADSVGAAGLQNGAVDSSKIADDAITASNLTSVLRNGTFWRLDGNAGTTTETHFLGTTDLRAFELKANDQRSLRLEPTTNSPNLIGGSVGNYVSNDVVGATVSGGGAAGMPNRIASYPSEWAPLSNAVPAFSTISGGMNNEIRSGRNNLVAGGANNSIVGWSRSYGSGNNNSIVGGARNRISSATASAVLGGEGNQILGSDYFGITRSAIVGGAGNIIIGESDPTSSVYFLGGSHSYAGRSSGGTIMGLGNSFGQYSGGQVNGGSNNSIRGFSSGTIGGGRRNWVDGSRGVVAGGSDNRSFGPAYSTIGGGGLHLNWYGESSTIPGGANALSITYGQFAYASGKFNNTWAYEGDAQTSVYVCRGITTNAVSTALSPDGRTASVKVTETLFDPYYGPADMSFNALVTGRTVNGESAGYEIKGMIGRNGILVGPPNVTVLGADNASWNASAVATNGTLAISVTGTENTTIRWVASIRTVEVR